MIYYVIKIHAQIVTEQLIAKWQSKQSQKPKMNHFICDDPFLFLKSVQRDDCISHSYNVRNHLHGIKTINII